MDENGLRSSEPSSRFDEDAFKTRLREAIADEQVARLDAERVVTESREREKRYQKALDAFESSPRKKPGPKPKTYQWHISSETTERVYDAFKLAAAERGPLSRREVAEAAGVSGEAARRALERLRGEERVRLAGHRVRGKNNQKTSVYDLMPDGS